MRTFLTILLFTAFARLGVAGAPVKDQELWITGDIFTQDDILLFRLDKPVKGNPTGAVVLLGAARDSAGVLFPLYIQAAEKKMKLRLYGILMPATPGITSKTMKLPNVQFITWKMHLPEDPDELPKDQKVIIQPGTTLPGYKIESVSSR